MNKTTGLYRLLIVLKWVARFLLFCFLFFLTALLYQMASGAWERAIFLELSFKCFCYWVLVEVLRWIFNGFSSDTNE
jgi:predicted neutral ceramidase superfamily lipid hydrolase